MIPPSEGAGKTLTKNETDQMGMDILKSNPEVEQKIKDMIAANDSGLASDATPLSVIQSELAKNIMTSRNSVTIKSSS